MPREKRNSRGKRSLARANLIFLTSRSSNGSLGRLPFRYFGALYVIQRFKHRSRRVAQQNQYRWDPRHLCAAERCEIFVYTREREHMPVRLVIARRAIRQCRSLSWAISVEKSITPRASGRQECSMPGASVRHRMRFAWTWCVISANCAALTRRGTFSIALFEGEYVCAYTSAELDCNWFSTEPGINYKIRDGGINRVYRAASPVYQKTSCLGKWLLKWSYIRESFC